MNRLAPITVAALLACCGFAFAQAPTGDQTPPDGAPKGAPRAKAKQADVKRLIVGDAAPELQIEKWVKGEPVTGFEKGKVYVVEFWATWCAPCKASMPHLTELQQQYKDKGLTIIGVASPGWRNTQTEVEDFVKDGTIPMGYTVAWDKAVATDEKDKNDKPVMLGATDSAYMKAARQSGIPRSFVVDGKGNLAWVGHPMELDYVLDDIVAGTWDYKESPAKIQQMKNEASRLLDDAETDPKGALAAMTEFEAKYPKMAPRLATTKYELQLSQGMYAEAYKTGATVVDQAVAHKDALSLNRLAWGIVDPEGSVKDKQGGLDLAMRAATKAVEITKEKDAAILDTLARCYWLKGNKVKAIDLQKRAISNLTKDEEEMRGQLQDTLKEYEGGSN
ncbi:MAG TPA: redoxin family protein [Phycisphaerales bacterium]|nr:redoxin family protein [Phycisphaerales bacterium]